jgi:hypothetical protein
LGYTERRDNATNEWKSADRERAQDIAPIPAVKDKARRDACARDFATFCKTYGAAMFRLAWSQDHGKAIERIEQAAINGGLFAFAMPRGSGKTTLCEWAVIWAILYGHARYVVFIGASEAAADKRIKSIKAILRHNDLLAEDFPEACHAIRRLNGEARKAAGQKLNGQPTEIVWGADQIVFATVPGAACSGAIIEGVGITGDIRGRAHTLQDGTKIRPTLAIVDDPQTRESAKSPKQCKDRIDTICGDIAYLAGPEADPIAVVIPCTVIAEGDVADEILDREKHPDFRGERSAMMLTFPANERLWEQYDQVRRQSLEEYEDLRLANEFYIKHRAELDAGASVSWPERFKRGEISAIQHAMNLKLRDEASFLAEYQNQPVGGIQNAVELLTEDQVAKRVSLVPWRIVPNDFGTLTAFIDISQRVLWWGVAAWGEDFSGSLIDYNVFPKQRTEYVTLAGASVTYSAAAASALKDSGTTPGFEAALTWALTEVSEFILGREWKTEAGTPRWVDRLLIDANWGQSTAIVSAFARRSRFAGKIYPSHGKGVTAKEKALNDLAGKPKPDERRGLHWRTFQPRDNGGRRVLYDTNYWKSFVYNRLSTAIGDSGALSLYNAAPHSHRMIAEQLTAEYCVRVRAKGREVEEWSQLPNRPDNHFLDVAVGCAVGASISGVSLPGQSIPRPKPKARRRGGVSALSA